MCVCCSLWWRCSRIYRRSWGKWRDLDSGAFWALEGAVKYADKSFVTFERRSRALNVMSDVLLNMVAQSIVAQYVSILLGP